MRFIAESRGLEEHMATGKQMLVAVKYELQQHPELKELTLNQFDVEDLCRAEAVDLQDFGATAEEAESVTNDLKSGSLERLSQWLGIKLVKSQKMVRNLIPGEGIRSAAGAWWTGNDTPDSIVQEIRAMRNATTR